MVLVRMGSLLCAAKPCAELHHEMFLGTVGVCSVELMAVRGRCVRRGRRHSMDVARMISELRSELQGIEQEIFLLERLDTRADRPVVQSVSEMEGASNRPTKPGPPYFD